MKFLSFLEWRKAQPTQVCDCCEGNGDVECDMGHQHLCDECEGTGERRYDTYRHYLEAIRHDLYKLAAWSGRDFLELAARFCKENNRGLGS